MTFKLNSSSFGSIVRAELYNGEEKVETQYLSSKSLTDTETILKYGIKFDPLNEVSQNSASDWCDSLKLKVVNFFRDSNDFYKIQLISDNIFPTIESEEDLEEELGYVPSITLSQESINEYFGLVVNATLPGRTLWRDGGWNTLCLPFSLTHEEIENGPLAGAIIMYLTDFEFDNGTGSFIFSFSDHIDAGKFFFIKWEPVSTNVVNPVFNNVKITNKTPLRVSVGDNLLSCGTYGPVVVGETLPPTTLYLGAGNTLYYPAVPMTIYEFRGYFQFINGFFSTNITRMLSIVREGESSEETPLSEDNIDFFQSVIYDTNEYTIIDLHEGIDKIYLFDKDCEFPMGNVSVIFDSLEKSCEKILIITLSPKELDSVINISSQIYKSLEDPHRNKNDYFISNSLINDDYFRVNTPRTLENRESQIGIGQADPDSFSYLIGNLAIDPISHVILGTSLRTSKPVLYEKLLNSRLIDRKSTWDKNTEYSIGDIVFCCGESWMSTISGNLGLHPLLSPWWKVVSLDSSPVNLIPRELPTETIEDAIENEVSEEEDIILPSYIILNYSPLIIETNIDEAEVIGDEYSFKYKSSIERTVTASSNLVLIDSSAILEEANCYEVTLSNLEPGKYYNITIS